DATCTIQLTCNGLGKGCTPGFWKTHPEVWDSYTDPVIAGGNNGAIPGLPAGLQFITTTSFNTYFGLVAGDAYLLNGKTMLNATQQNGGGCNALARHGVSALLNAAAFGNDYLSFVGFGVTSYQDLYNALKTAFKTGNCTALATKLGEINTAFDINGICSNLSKATPNPAIANKLNQLVTIASDADQSDLKVSYYPNPFRDRITFNFVSPVSGRATLEVYNIAGQRVAVVFDGTVRAGIANSVNYDAKGKAAGMIIYKLNVEGKTVRGKIQQIK
ncbi:MAG: T9SS type A sorting domain-containing protein, partial [Sphingobacteriales bacterium]|nr:T9SS type A sorting domain-containing protein [Sphingobacteriales bacterium]